MRQDSLLPTDWPGGWPVSNYLILLTVLFLVATALALVVSTESVANETATYAYFALIVGVLLRLTEHVAEDRLRRLCLQSLSGLKAGWSTAMTALGERLTIEWPLVSQRSHSNGRARNRRIALLTLIGTAIGGTVLLVVRSSDPTTVPSRTFLVGWTLSLWLASAVYVASRPRS